MNALQNVLINKLDDQQEEAREQEYRDLIGPFFFKRKFKIVFTKNKEVKMISSDGEIIRSYIMTNCCYKNLEIPFNFEQVKHLQWIGKYQDMKKVGKWTATWNNKILVDVGGQYCQKGMKQGQWKELFKNFYDKAQVFEEGDYINNLRTGKWSIIYENKLIGGGIYNEKGQKYGQWIELNDYFQNDNQIIYQGEYYNCKKACIWNIYRKRLAIFLNINSCKKTGNQSLEIIGMEKYDQQGRKNGKWVELSEHFQKETQIIYCGEYNNGKKCGIWDIYHQTYSNRPFYLIGCGIYNDQGLKIGMWFEQSENFQNNGQIIYEGQYKNGIKIGKWYIKSKSGQILERIGYGSYDEQGLKNDIWLELSENYQNCNSEITYYGKYKNNKKIGKWEIQNKKFNKNPYELIGGGLYNDQGLKYGNWIDLIEDFSSWKEIICKGVFHNGGKIGRWDLQFRSPQSNYFRNIGGGSYDNNNFKNGSWIDICADFSKNQRVVHKGVYDHGKKIGLWEEIRLCEDNGSLKIGQKKYD
ncbi:unnamed protein product [Paramecium sonneborni]|uniref:Uncharacterized protein n=1 Tax=Paramecium sonneborni TaxID=65129 RepID=A0A8S1QAV2_9CILI|nr:unnamed protein product [Paramecium sonneborni]